MTDHSHRGAMALNLALLAGSLLLALGIMEATLRAFPNLMPEDARLRIHWRELVGEKVSTIEDPYLGFLYPPDFSHELGRHDVRFSFTTDEKGFRNPGPWPSAADIVVVGDSWTFGYGVEDREAWVAQVDRRLPGTSIVNLGLIGGAPQQYGRIYEIFGRPLRPKLLIYGLFPGNDLHDARQFENWLVAESPGNYDVWRFFGGQVPGSRSLLARSYLLQSIRSIWKGLRTPFSGETIEFDDGRRLRLAPGVLAASVAVAKPDHPDFQLVMDSVEHARNLAVEDGSEFLVLLYPTKEEVYLPLLGKPTPAMIPPFVEELERRGISFLDLTKPFQERARAGARLYFEIDGHANGAGSAVIADALVEHLRENAEEYSLDDESATPVPLPLGT